jgi:hypothetical protein
LNTAVWLCGRNTAAAGQAAGAGGALDHGIDGTQSHPDRVARRISAPVQAAARGTDGTAAGSRRVRGDRKRTGAT